MKPSRENIFQDPNESLKIFRLESPRLDCPFHFHPELELTLIEEGYGLRILGDHVASFSDGDLCLIGSNLPHIYESDKSTQAYGSRLSRAVVLQFPLSPWIRMFEELPELRGLSKLCALAGNGLVFPAGESAEAAGMLSELPEKTGPARVTAFLKLMDVLQGLESHPAASPGYTFNAEELGSEPVTQACELIMKAYQEKLPHHEVARKVGLSPSAFSRLFRRTTGMTFTQFLNRVRLGQAARLLQETDMIISEIALNSGFENLSNFNRRFRERYGRSPREYRKLTT